MRAQRNVFIKKAYRFWVLKSPLTRKDKAKARLEGPKKPEYEISRQVNQMS